MWWSLNKVLNKAIEWWGIKRILNRPVLTVTPHKIVLELVGKKANVPESSIFRSFKVTAPPGYPLFWISRAQTQQLLWRAPLTWGQKLSQKWPVFVLRTFSVFNWLLSAPDVTDTWPARWWLVPSEYPIHDPHYWDISPTPRPPHHWVSHWGPNYSSTPHQPNIFLYSTDLIHAFKLFSEISTENMLRYLNIVILQTHGLNYRHMGGELEFSIRSPEIVKKTKKNQSQISFSWKLLSLYLSCLKRRLSCNMLTSF